MPPQALGGAASLFPENFCACPGSVHSFGTTRELLHLVTEDIDNYEFLDWKRQVLGVEEEEGSCACSSSYIERAAEGGGFFLYRRQLYYSGTVVEDHCVISAVTLRGQRIPDHTVLHGLKQKDGSFAVRVYGVNDNPKGTLEDGASFLKGSLAGFLEAAGLAPEEVWTGKAIICGRQSFTRSAPPLRKLYRRPWSSCSCGRKGRAGGGLPCQKASEPAGKF